MKKNDEISIKELFAIIVQKMWLIAVFAIVFGAAFGIYSGLFKADTYTCSSKIMVTKDTTGAGTASDRVHASDMIELFSVMITESNEIKAYVISEFEKNYPELVDKTLTERTLSNLINVSQLGNTEVFQLSVTTDNAQKSYAIAKIITDYIVLGEGENNIKSKITYTDIEARVIDNPSSNVSKNSRKVTFNILIGSLIGIAIALVIVFVYDNFDIKIRNKKRLEENFDIPVLGIIPRFDVEGGNR
jgi:capsular polysaccharide biosynthesis protein